MIIIENLGNKGKPKWSKNCNMVNILFEEYVLYIIKYVI